MRWLRREAFRTGHVGIGRMLVVSHSWGDVIGAAALTLAILAGAAALAFGFA